MGRVEIFQGRARRRWSEDDKRRLVAETLAPGETVHGVARQRGVSTSRLFSPGASGCGPKAGFPPAMPKFDRPKSVPKGMRATYDAVVRLTDELCDRHLNAEYRNLARDMAAALCRKRPSPLASGQPRTWACGIIYLLGQINFLSD